MCVCVCACMRVPCVLRVVCVCVRALVPACVCVCTYAYVLDAYVVCVEGIVCVHDACRGWGGVGGGCGFKTLSPSV